MLNQKPNNLINFQKQQNTNEINITALPLTNKNELYLMGQLGKPQSYVW